MMTPVRLEYELSRGIHDFIHTSHQAINFHIKTEPRQGVRGAAKDCDSHPHWHLQPKRFTVFITHLLDLVDSTRNSFFFVTYPLPPSPILPMPKDLSQHECKTSP